MENKDDMCDRLKPVLPNTDAGAMNGPGGR